MKRKTVFLITALNLALLLCCFFICVSSSSVFAEEADPNPTLGYVIPSGLFEDVNLYNALATEYSNNKPAGEEYDNNGKLYEDMFKVAGITTLDLSGTWEISSIADLGYFDLTEVQELDLSFNNLTGNIDLTGFTALQRVNISNNDILGITITNLDDLDEVILNNNRICNIDLCSFSGSSVDLAMNNFTSMSCIVLPEDTSVVSFTVNLVNNNITDAIDVSDGGVLFNLGAQGISRGLIPESNETIFYKMQNTDIKAVIAGEGVTYSSTDYTEDVTSINLTPGIYTLQYLYTTDDSSVWVDGQIYNFDTVWKTGYKPVDFIVRPDSPTYIFYVDGTAVNSLTKISDENIELEVEIAQGIETFTSTDGINWTDYDGKVVLENKSQTIYLKTSQNGIDSQVVTLNLVYEKDAIPVGLTIIYILLFLAGLAGAGVLVKKYIIDKAPNHKE